MEAAVQVIVYGAERLPGHEQGYDRVASKRRNRVGYQDRQFDESDTFDMKGIVFYGSINSLISVRRGPRSHVLPWIMFLLCFLSIAGRGAAQQVKATQIASSFSSTLVVKADGTVWTLGNTPVQVTGLSNVIAVASGSGFWIALKKDGTVWAWGTGTYGRLGNGSTNNSAVPVQVTGLSNIIAISAGEENGLALGSGGQVYGWGNNAAGQLGFTGPSVSSPVQVMGISNVVMIASGYFHSMALKSDGTVWAWGANTYGNLGNNSTTLSSTPLQVNGLANVTSISAGGYDSMAITSDSTVWGWGFNDEGQLGPIATYGSSVKTPVALMSGLQVAAATEQLLVMTASGITTIGSGPGFLVPENIPFSNLVAVSGISGSYAVTSDGSLWSWGAGLIGANHAMDNTVANVPMQTGVSGGMTALAAQGSHAVALMADGSLQTWGSQFPGSSLPEPVAAGSNTFRAIAAGEEHYLALANDGTVYAWGLNPDGELGNGTTTDSATPIQISALGGTATAVAAGSTHSLALLDNGTVMSWGAAAALGRSFTGTPGLVSALSGVTSIAAGGNCYSLALRNDGMVLEWGIVSSTSTLQTPAVISGLSNVVAIATSGYESVALETDGSVWQWNGASGSAGVVQVSGLSDIVAISAGYSHFLALDSSGAVWAWGTDAAGELGNGSQTASSIPVQVNGLVAIAIAAGNEVSLALKQDGTLMSWGDSAFGETGIGLMSFLPTPLQVLGFNFFYAPPTASFSSPLPNSTTNVLYGQSQTLQFSTTQGDNPVASVQLWSHGALLGTAAGSSGSFTWQANTWGNFQLSLIAQDDHGVLSLRSAPIQITVPFDSAGNGLPDWWQLQYFGHLGVDPNADPDGDGLTNLAEYQAGSSPNDFYNGTLPILQINGGNGQVGPAAVVLPSALSVLVTNSAGLPLANAPVVVSVTAGGGQIAISPTGALASSQTVTTAADGTASVWLAPGGMAGSVTSNVVTVAVTAGGQTVTVSFDESGSPLGTPPAPTGITLTVNPDGTVTIGWMESSSGQVTGYLIERSDDGGVTWTVVDTADPTATTYVLAADVPITPGVTQFRVTAQNSNGSTPSTAGGTPSDRPGPRGSASVPLATFRSIGYVGIDLSSAAPANAANDVSLLTLDDQNNAAFEFGTGLLGTPGVDPVGLYQVYTWQGGTVANVQNLAAWNITKGSGINSQYWVVGVGPPSSILSDGSLFGDEYFHGLDGPSGDPDNPGVGAWFFKSTDGALATFDPPNPPYDNSFDIGYGLGGFLDISTDGNTLLGEAGLSVEFNSDSPSIEAEAAVTFIRSSNDDHWTVFSLVADYPYPYSVLYGDAEIPANLSVPNVSFLPTAINNQSCAIGRDLAWTQGEFWDGAEIIPLGALTTPGAINDQNLVVGYSTDSTGNNATGLLWNLNLDAPALPLQYLVPADLIKLIQNIYPIDISNADGNNIVSILCSAQIWEGSPTPSWTNETILFQVNADTPDLGPKVYIVNMPASVKWLQSINVSAAVAAFSDPAVTGTQHALLNLLVTLSCPIANATTKFVDEKGNPLGIAPNYNPAYFAKADPPDPTLSKSQEPALVVFYKDAINSSFVVQPFTVKLDYGTLPSGVGWKQTKGPSGTGAGTLQNASNPQAQYVNPTVGGLYQFDGTIGTDSSTVVRTSLILPLAGAEVKDIVASDITATDTFVAAVVARYSLIQRNSRSLNYKFFWNGGSGDYLGRADNASSKTCVRFNSVNDSTGFGSIVTWFGVPVRMAKVSNFLVGYAQEKIGVWSALAYLGRGAGTKDDASGAASYGLGWNVAAGTKTYATDTVTMLKANFYGSDAKNTRLWPNAFPADNHVSSSTLTDYNTQFCSPAFTEITSP